MGEMHQAGPTSGHAPLAFISFAVEDRDVATWLYRELNARGIVTFEFEENATPGGPAWPEVISQISRSDLFLLLVSRASLESRAVAEELEHAHHGHVNTQRPSRLVALMLEPDLTPPPLMVTRTQLDFWNREAGLARLLDSREPRRTTPGTSAVESAADRAEAAASTAVDRASTSAPTPAWARPGRHLRRTVVIAALVLAAFMGIRELVTTPDPSVTPASNGLGADGDDGGDRVTTDGAQVDAERSDEASEASLAKALDEQQRERPEPALEAAEDGTGGG